MAEPVSIPPAGNGSRLSGMFRSLKHRNFRLFFMGQAISLLGTWMQLLTVSWLVGELTSSNFTLGLVWFLGRLPTLLLAPFIGVLVDRVNRHRLVTSTQCLAMLQALALAMVMILGHAAIWNIIILEVCLGLINAFDVPGRQAFMIQMVEDRDDLTNAIALNSSLFNGTRLLGPTIAGVILAAAAALMPGRYMAGEITCVLINGLSYTAVIGGLLMMRVKPNPRVARDSHPLHNLKEGFRHSFGFPPIRSILLLLAVVSLTGQSYATLLPRFAKQVLGGNATTQGLLMGAAGVGALSAAIYLAMRTTVRGLGRIIGFAPTIMGAGLIGLGLSTRLWTSLLAMAVIGLGLMLQTASSNTILQTIADDDKRGRIMSFYSLSFMGMVPLGSLFAGGLAAILSWLMIRVGVPPAWTDALGVQGMVIIGGACCIVGSVWFSRKLPALRELVHPIYVRKGIIPEVARGIQATSDQRGPASEHLGDE